LQRAKASKTQAISKYENQKIQNKTNLTEAKLQLDLAECDLEHYCDQQLDGQLDGAPEGSVGGLFAIELQDVELRIQTQLAEQMIAKENLDAIELLHKLGFRNRGELDGAEVDLLKSQSQLATAIAEKRELEKYTFTKEMLTREEAVATARNNLEQVKRNNQSELQQAEAARDSAIRAYDKEKERYERYLEQREQCRIHAPQDGMVAYAAERRRGGSQTSIEKGAFVRERQDMLTLPDLSRMQVETAVHESVLDQVRKGLDAVIQVDAFPERRYHGSVKSVAVLPDQGNWFSSDTKVYETIVTIDEDVRQLKPGMTAVVEIDIEQLEDVISVPIQTVVQRGQTNWCFVRKGGKLERREITLGKTNDKFVEVREGLDTGEVVVLNPSSLMEEREEEREVAGKDAQGKTAKKDAQGKTAKKDARKKPRKASPGRPKSKKAKTSQSSGVTGKTRAPKHAEAGKARKPPAD
ncbi:MAG: efflux RND transporter periplasmic adaptor subunit, partial [Planctomycetota bacterium]